MSVQGTDKQTNKQTLRAVALHVNTFDNSETLTKKNSIRDVPSSSALH